MDRAGVRCWWQHLDYLSHCTLTNKTRNYMFATLLDKLHLVTRASRLCGGNGIGLSGEESTTWKPSRLQGVGPMGMLADDPKGRKRPPSRRGRIGKPTTGAVWPD